MAKTTQVLVHEFSGQVLHLQQVHNETLKRLRAIHEDYKALSLPAIDKRGISDLVNHTDSFIRTRLEMLIGELPTIGPFQVKRSAILDTIEMPNYSHITRQVQELKQYWNQKHTRENILNNFLVKDDTIEIDSKALTAALDANRIYASTSKELKVYDALKTILEAYKNLDAITGECLSGSGGLRSFKPECYLMRNDNNELLVNPDFYQKLIHNF
jgi:hypothetical protein